MNRKGNDARRQLEDFEPGCRAKPASLAFGKGAFCIVDAIGIPLGFGSSESVAWQHALHAVTKGA